MKLSKTELFESCTREFPRACGLCQNAHYAFSTSVLWGIVRIASVLWRLFSTVGDNISTYGGLTSVLWRVFNTVGDSFSTVGDTFNTVEVVQYSGDNINTVGDSFSTMEVFSTLGDNISTCRRITSVLWRVFSTVD